jgi:hypothetical protein
MYEQDNSSRIFLPTSEQLVGLIAVVDAGRAAELQERANKLEEKIDRRCAELTPEQKAAWAKMRAARALAKKEGRPFVYEE